jgi:hypothetical protein
MATTAASPSSQQSTSTTLTPSAIQSAISKLQELGINFLAIDFDQTILDIHTGGRWTDSLEELLPHVRPVFAQLIQAALQNNIHVAICTFTSQIKLVRGVLDYMVGIDAAQKIPIRGGDRSWQYNNGVGGGSLEGKQPHMASAVEELETRREYYDTVVEISKKTTLLIDDDSKNIRFALVDQTRAIWLNPKKPHLLLQDIIKLV